MNELAPVVLIHGMWSTPDTLVELRNIFESKGYEVYSPRLPFHFPIEEMTSKNIAALKGCGMEEYVNEISVLVSSLDRPPIVVGHSMGGVLAQ